MNHERIGDRRRRQGEIEDRALTRLALGPDASAVTIDDARDRREPDTRSAAPCSRWNGLNSFC
jgi:hypothetical protein